MTGACRPALSSCRERARHGATVSNRFNRWATAKVRVRVLETLAESRLTACGSTTARSSAGGGLKRRVGITPLAVLVADRAPGITALTELPAARSAPRGSWTSAAAAPGPFPSWWSQRTAARLHPRRSGTARFSAPSVPASVAGASCSSDSSTRSDAPAGWPPAARHLPETTSPPSSSSVTVPGQHITLHERASRSARLCQRPCSSCCQ